MTKEKSFDIAMPRYHEDVASERGELLEFSEYKYEEDLSEQVVEHVEDVKEKLIQVGSKVRINTSATRFCDGRGISKYLYDKEVCVKYVNEKTNTVTLELSADGKDIGVLFTKDVTAVN